jgi:hypothetical protein
MSVHTSQPRPPSPVPKAMPMRNAVGCSLQVQVCPRGRALHTVQGAFPSHSRVTYTRTCDFVLAVFDKCIPELCNGAPLWRRCSLVICRGVIR